jgi:hypothetical protein
MTLNCILQYTYKKISAFICSSIALYKERLEHKNSINNSEAFLGKRECKFKTNIINKNNTVMYMLGNYQVAQTTSGLSSSAQLPRVS